MEKSRELFDKPTTNPLTAMAFMPKRVRFESQNNGEDVFILLRQHWATNISWVLNTIVGLLLPFITVVVYSHLLGGDLFELSNIIVVWVIWYLILCSYIFHNFLKWFFNAYIITNQRILDLDFYGLLHSEISEAALVNIEDVSSSHVGIWQNLFDYGHIRIQTAGESQEFGFANVPRPGYIQDKIMDLADMVKSKDI